MPQNKFALVRYRIIDNLLRSRSYVKTSEITEYCRTRTGFRVSRRTIEMDLQAMQFDEFLGFFAPIAYHTGQKAYYYTDPGYHLQLFHFTHEEVEILKSVREMLRGKLSDEQTSQLDGLIDRIETGLKMAK